MKTSRDPRHLKREAAVSALFALPFHRSLDLSNALARRIVKHVKRIDQCIGIAAPERAVNKINRIDLAILRLAVWELKIERKNPPKVIIDEAVELSKKYGAEQGPAFINGVLATILKNQ